MINRILRIDLPQDRSAFLWGPRKTGKTTLLKQQFPDALRIDLLDHDLYLRLAGRPSELGQMIGARGATSVVIDEIQKAPNLIDEVHRLIEDRGVRFVLSGSSARKMRRSGAGLLGGRAWRYELHPLVTAEVPDLDLDRALVSGLLPSHYLSAAPARDLSAYVHDYLKEEIQAEALTRNLPAFSRFLRAAALTSGGLLNYSNAAREAGVSSKTIREYYQILEDTLIGHLLMPWRKAGKRRLIETSKFYLFDVGVLSALLGTGRLAPGTSEYGRAFEHFVVQECRAYCRYRRSDTELSFWRTASGAEVDLIVGDAEAAIEIKSTDRAPDGTRGLHLFAEETGCVKTFVVSRDPVARRLASGVTVLPWREFCAMLWSGEIV